MKKDKSVSLRYVPFSEPSWSEWTAADIVQRIPVVFITIESDEYDLYSSTAALLIEYEDTLNKFVAKARAVWNSKHAGARQRGRPSERARVIRALWEAKEAGHIWNRSSQGKVI